MKRKNLPLSLFLILIALTGIITVFSLNKDASEYTPRESAQQLYEPAGKPAGAFLAKIKNNQHTGLINPADLKRVQGELETIKSSRAFNMMWKQLGPDNFGGRTRAILADNKSTAVYAAGVSGGIWKSVNGGITWAKVNADFDNLFVSSFTQTSNGDIYAGTGESFDAETVSGLDQMGYSSGFMGTGIYKSSDGESFSLLASTKPTFNDITSDWAFVNELATDPGTGRIYAATNTGLKYSNDAGGTWTTAKDNEGNELSLNSFDVQVGSDGNVVTCVDNKAYISVSGNPNSFVFKSSGDSVSLPDGNVSRIEFAIAPSDASVIYASVVNSLGSVNNIYRSDNKGETWRIVMPGTQSINVFDGQGVYNNALAVYPDDPDKVLLGGIDLWLGQKLQEDGYFDWSTRSESFTFPLIPSYLHADHHVYEFLPGSNNTFFIGTDGGVSIGTIASDGNVYQSGNRNYFTTQFYAAGPSGLKNHIIGGAQDNGTIKITGQGNTEQQGEQILGGDGGPCVISLIDPNVIVITGTAGTILRSDDGGINYSNPAQFPGNVGNPQAFRTPVVLMENFNNINSLDSVTYYVRETIPGGAQITVRSENSGQPFYYTTPEGTTLYAGDSIRVQDIVTSFLFIGVSNHMWLTTELHQFAKAVEWFNVSNSDFGGVSGTPYSLGISADGNHLFVGTLDGKLFRVSNLAFAQRYELADVNSPGCIVASEQIELLIPGTDEEISQVVTSISVDPQDPNNIIVTLGNYGNDHYVLLSENALDKSPTFISAQGNLPHMPVYSSVIEMTDQNLAILGTEHGIFATENIHAGPPDWVEQGNEMGSVPVFDLKQQIVSQPQITLALQNGPEIIYITYPGTHNWGSIYAATYGRGLFINDDFYMVDMEEIAATDKEKGKIKLYPNPVVSVANIEFSSELSINTEIKIFDLSGRLIKLQSAIVRKGPNRIAIAVDDLKQGTYILSVVIGPEVYTQKFIVN